MTVTSVQVDASRTPSTPAEIEGAIAAGYKAIVGHDAPSVALTLMAAQSALETDAWKSMYNWNLGYITHGSDNFDWMVVGSNPLHFRAYTSLDQGAADFVNYLNRTGVLDFAASGDIRGYVNRLRETGYAGKDADYGAYLAGMQRYSREFSGVVPVVPTEDRGFHVPAWAAALALGFGTFLLTRRGS